MYLAVLVVIGNIHCTKYVSEIGNITIGQIELVKILQSGNFNVVTIGNLRVYCILHTLYVLREISILISRHNTPRAGVIAINTGTNVLDNKCNRILTGIFLYVLTCNFLQQHQVEDEIVIVINNCRANCRNNDDLTVNFSASFACIIRLVSVFITSGSLCRNRLPVMTKSCNKLCTAYGTGLCGYTSSLLTVSMSGCRNVIIIISIATYASIGGITLYSTRRSSCSYCTVRVTGSRNFFLRNENLTTFRTMLTLGKTCFGTCRSYCVVNYLGMSKSINNLIVAIAACTSISFRSSICAIRINARS